MSESIKTRYCPMRKSPTTPTKTIMIKGQGKRYRCWNIFSMTPFSFHDGSKYFHFRNFEGMKILVVISRAKVRVLRQKSSHGLKWETLSLPGP